MSLQSYEAICHQGQIKWLNDCPQVEEARVIVTVLSSEKVAPTRIRHQASPRIAGKGKVLGDIIAPAASVNDWNCAE
ncbi:MAG: hypothetical protein J0665_15545 [Deltaproteobacteria bacterium]|nr:hypothetical protein [Deltaproteobacteria bacterium]